MTIIDRRVNADPMNSIVSLDAEEWSRLNLKRKPYDPFTDDEPIEPSNEDEEVCDACQ